MNPDFPFDRFVFFKMPININVRKIIAFAFLVKSAATTIAHLESRLALWLVLATPFQ